MRKRPAAVPLVFALIAAGIAAAYVMTRTQRNEPTTSARSVEPPASTTKPPPASVDASPPKTTAPPPPQDPLLKPADPARSIIPADAAQVRVKTVVDGDTVHLEDGRKVRYLGMDTPEHDEKFFEEAKQLNASLVTGRPVYLEFDVEQKDRYGRILAYLYVRLDNGEEKLVNAELLRAGLARLYTFPPNVRHVETLRACQKEAIEAQRGQWKEYVFTSEPYFVATKNGRAFHRPKCAQIANAKPDSLIKYATAKEALADDKSPCRTCKP